MSFRNFLMGTAGVAAVAALGCVVTEEEPGGATDPYPTTAAFCQALAEAECNDDVIGVCFGADASTLAENRPKCVTARVDACNPLDLPKYTSKAAPDCITKRKEVIADAKLSAAEVKEADEACLPVLSRGGASGSTCTAHVDCDTAADLRCVIKLGEASGTCEVPQIIPRGDDCGAVGAVCEDGYYCSSGNCIAQEGLSEMCGETAPCASGLKCSVPTGGVCVEKAADTEACTTDADCAGGFCLPSASGSLCSSTYLLEFSSPTCDDYR